MEVNNFCVIRIRDPPNVGGREAGIMSSEPEFWSFDMAESVGGFRSIDPVIQPNKITIYPDCTLNQRMKDLIPILQGKVLGRYLTDSELMEVHTFLKETAEKLWAFGPEFMLAVRGVEQLFHEAESYRQARCRQ